MPPHTTVGALIRERRLILGLTQEQLAERVGGGLRQSEVSRLERGRTKLPRRQSLEAIAAALDLSTGELLAASAWASEPNSSAPYDPGTHPRQINPVRPAEPFDLARWRETLCRAEESCTRVAETLARLRHAAVLAHPTNDRRTQATTLR